MTSCMLSSRVSIVSEESVVDIYTEWMRVSSRSQRRVFLPASGGGRHILCREIICSLMLGGDREYLPIYMAEQVVQPQPEFLQLENLELEGQLLLPK